MSERDAADTDDPEEPNDERVTGDGDRPGEGAAADGSAGGHEDGTSGDEWQSLEEITEELDREQGEIDVDEDLAQYVADADDDELATEIASLRSRVEALESKLAEREAEREDLESRLKRTQADFQNYKKRMQKRREEEKQRATEDLVERLIDVRDNLTRALDQDEDADIRDGIEATLRSFDEELERENVAEIAPEPGSEVDPQRHEVLLRVASDQPEGAIAEVHRPGYEMAEKVLRPAQVTVSEGAGGDGGD